MARKKSSRKKSASISLPLLIAFLAILIVVGVLYGWDTVAEMLGIDLGTPAPVADQPAGDVSAGSSGEFITVYFTDPVIPFDDVTTGGIETHLIDLINGAQSSIDLAVFEFNLQNVADALIAAHKRGVAVRVVYDDEHTEEDPQMDELIKAGIPARPDERSAYMHNKFFVFDRQLVWTGSTNVTVNGVYRNNNNAIVIRSSQLAANYTTEFEEMFSGEFGPTSPVNTPNPVFTLNGVQIENYFASEDTVMPRLAEVVSAAKASIHFMTFAFTYDELGQAMLERLQNGVAVVGIFEQRGASTEYSQCNPLLNAGADVRLDGNPRTFHHKVIIVDSSIVIVGSFNFSSNATESNDENLLIIHDPGVAAQYEAEFNRRLAEAQYPVGGICKTD